MCELGVDLKFPLGDYIELYSLVRRHVVDVLGDTIYSMIERKSRSDAGCCLSWKGLIASVFVLTSAIYFPLSRLTSKSKKNQ